MGENLSPNIKIRIGGILFGTGTRFKRGILINGIDIFEYYGKDIEGEIDDYILVVTGFHK